MLDDLTISLDYVRVIAEQLRHSGASVDEWLQKSGMPEEPLGPVPYPVFRRLVRSALTAAREPALGLFVGERLVAAAHGIVGFAAVNGSTVRQAIEVIERFSRLRTELLTISHELGDEELRVVFNPILPLGDIERPMLEAVVVSIRNALDASTLGGARVNYVAFPFEAPEYAALAHEIFRCDVRYGEAWAGFSCSPEVLDISLKLADPSTFRETALICQRELERLVGSESISASTRRLLLEKQHGFPTLALAARLLHLAPRTLHRRLIDEGTSYRELLDSVRHTLAVEHMRSGRFSLDEIAYRLGYTDVANFRRAFKRWESVSPSAFRRREKQAPRS
jgi:AraC-like DNA-binding protein